MTLDDSSSSDGGTDDSSSSDSSIGDAGASDYPSSDDGSSDGGSSDGGSSDGGSSDGTSSDGSSSSSINAGWKTGVVSGGWNSDVQSVGGVRRIPIDGLTRVNQDPAPNPNTTESAAGRAILVVPGSLDTSQGIDVLLHLHGHNVGYRQRVASSLPDAGTVRDVLVDQIEDRIDRSGRAMIAVLPQGTPNSGFAPRGAQFDCDSFLDEALNAAVTAGVWSSVPAVQRVVLSGHSGAGGTIGPMAGESGHPRLPSKLAAMFLFEAINGSNELAGITTYVTGQLNADLQNLSTAPDKLAYLKSSLRFRGVYNTGDTYYAGYYASVKQTIASWFARNADAIGGAGSDAYNAFVANYVIVTPSPYVAHDGLLGSGNLLLALGMLS